jgi:hypothetical protein
MKFQGGDLVYRTNWPDGPRGMVLGYDDYGYVMVCWQTGYNDYTEEDEAWLSTVDVLDLMVEAFDGLETRFRYCWPG